MKRLYAFIVILLLNVQTVFSQSGPCIGSQSLTASPAPTANGTYFSNTVVTFCYTVSNYSQTSAEWLCGVVPSFGPGWDLSTLQPVSAPPSCDGLGYWGWFPSCNSTASGSNWGPGFFYDTPSGSPGGAIDSIPGNNFGDNCQNNTWTFCFSIEVADCIVAPNGTDLTVNVNSYGDYLAGSWGGVGCVDPPVTLVAEVFCNCTLIVPTINVTNTTCSTVNNGSITPFPQGVPPYTYQWSTGATTQTISNLAPGIYTLTVTDSTTCTKVVTIPVSGPQPIVLNPTIIPNGCSGSGGSVSLSPTGGLGSVFTYLWSNGSTASSITGLTGGTYSVTVTDSTGCTGSGSYVINTIAPIIVTTSATPSLCNGPNATATATATGGVGGFSYLWSPGGQTTAQATGLTGGTYIVTVTDTAGCTSADTVLVSVLNDLATAAYGDTTVCSGEQVTIGTNSTGGTTPYQYNWNNGANASTQTLSPAIAGTYIVTVTDVNGCETTDTVLVGVVDYPVLSVSNDTTICFGGAAPLSATGGPSYTWAPSSGLNDPASATPVATPSTTTTYTVSTAYGNCVSSETVTVTVEPEVVASFTPDSTQGDAPFTVNFTSNSSGFNSAVWDFGDGNDTLVNGAVPVIHTYTQQGSYTVTLTITNSLGCTDTARYTFIVVNEYSAIFIPSVFTPNGDGANDVFELTEDKLTSVEVIIVSRWGKEVASWNKLGGSWDGKSKDGEELPDGSYFYVIKAKGIDGKQYDYQGTIKLLRTK